MQFSFLLVFLVVSIVYSQFTQYYLPEGSDQNNAEVMYSFSPNPQNSDEIVMEITVLANKWVGLGFADSSGTTATNLFMEGTYAWVFANFDWDTNPSKLTGDVWEFKLGKHAIGTAPYPETIKTEVYLYITFFHMIFVE